MPAPADARVSCDDRTCTVTGISAAVKAEIEALDGHEERTIRFENKSNDAQFATVANLPWLRKLHIAYADVTRLDPLKGLVHLQELDAGSLVTEARIDLRPLAGLTKLKELSFYGVEVSHEDPALCGKPDMRRLSLYLSEVSSIRCLTEMKQLAYVSIYGAEKISDIEPLRGLNELEDVSLHGTRVRDLSPLAGATALTHIDVAYTEIGSIAALRGATGLVYLAAGNTGLSDLSPLSGKPKLWSIDISETRVGDLSALRDLPQLERIYMHETAITDLAALATLPKLSELYASKSAITSIEPLRGNKKLSILKLAGTKVTDFAPLADLPGLYSLDLEDTAISDLSPLHGLAKLHDVNVSGTPAKPGAIEALRAALPKLKIYRE